jgi:hypothetical protein
LPLHFRFAFASGRNEAIGGLLKWANPGRIGTTVGSTCDLELRILLSR